MKPIKIGLAVCCGILAIAILLYIQRKPVGPLPSSKPPARTSPKENAVLPEHSTNAPNDTVQTQPLTLVEESEYKTQCIVLLKRLSLVALDIDAGKVSLRDKRNARFEPDSLMWELRLLVHKSPSLAKVVADFLEQGDAPIGAKLFAILALAYPLHQEVAAMIGKAIADSSDQRIGIAASLCYSVAAHDGIGRVWNKMFNYFRLFEMAKGYSYPGNLEYNPSDSGENVLLFRSSSQAVDVEPIRNGLLKLLERPELGDIRNKLLRISSSFVTRAGVPAGERSRLRKVAEDSYLKDKKDWRTALDVMMRLPSDDVTEDISVIGKGFESKGARDKVVILEELVRVDSLAIFKAPFEGYLSECLTVIGTESVGGATSMVNYERLCWCLVVNWPNENLSKNMLSGHPSSVLRRRVSGAMSMYASLGKLPLVELKRVAALASIMMNDRSDIVSLNAARATLALLEKNEFGEIPMERSHLLREFEGWIRVFSERNLSISDRNALTSLSDRYNRIKS